MGSSEGLSAEQAAWMLESSLDVLLPDIFVEIEDHVDTQTQAKSSASWSGWIHTDLAEIRPEEMQRAAPGGDILWLQLED